MDNTVVVEIDAETLARLSPAAVRDVLRAVARINHHIDPDGPAVVCRCLHGDYEHRRGDGACEGDDDLVEAIAWSLPPADRARVLAVAEAERCPCRRLEPIPESFPLG